jgi:2,4-dienoyl-CoA reductase (NADPH2)
MSRHEPFRFRSAGELLAKAAELGAALPFQDEIRPLFETIRVAGKTIPNRIAVQPMEGFDASCEGAPEELTFRRYRRYAAGGNGLIWFEACSVSPDGRSNPRQLVLNRGTCAEFRRLVDETRRAAWKSDGSTHGPFLVLQLTHSGRFRQRESGAKQRAACWNPRFDRSPDEVDLFEDSELASIGDQFCEAASLAWEAGFDGIDVKACHGYLLHELLASMARKDSIYGGAFENRSRLLLDIVRRVRTEVPGLALAVRMNATDGIEHGFGVQPGGSTLPDLAEPFRLRDLLADAGCALLNITAGIPVYTPHLGRPFDRPARGGAHPDMHPLESVCHLIRLAAAFQGSCPGLPVVGTGYSWLRHFWPNVGAAVLAQKEASFIGLGRNAFAYPDAPLDLMRTGALSRSKCCSACSCCTDLMRNRQVTGCVIRDRAIYKQAYRKIRR